MGTKFERPDVQPWSQLLPLVCAIACKDIRHDEAPGSIAHVAMALSVSAHELVNGFCISVYNLLMICDARVSAPAKVHNTPISMNIELLIDQRSRSVEHSCAAVPHYRFRLDIHRMKNSGIFIVVAEVIHGGSQGDY